MTNRDRMLFLANRARSLQGETNVMPLLAEMLRLKNEKSRDSWHGCDWYCCMDMRELGKEISK